MSASKNSLGIEVLFNLAIDPRCFADPNSSNVERDTILDCLSRFGILSYNIDDLDEMKRHMSQSEFHRWINRVRASPCRKRGARLPSNPQVGELKFGRDGGLVVLGDDFFESWANECGPGDDDGLVRAPGGSVEAAHARSITRAEHLRRSVSWSNGHLTNSDTGHSVWVRLSPLVATSKSMVIVDPYAVSTTVANDIGRLGSDGLLWLFDRIGEIDAEGEPDLDITLLTKTPDGLVTSPCEELADDLLRRASSSARSVTVAMVGSNTFSGLEHGRYMRFAITESSRLVTLDHGLDQLSDEPFRVRVGFKYEVLDPEMREYLRVNEQKLLRAAQTVGRVASAGA